MACQTSVWRDFFSGEGREGGEDTHDLYAVTTLCGYTGLR